MLNFCRIIILSCLILLPGCRDNKLCGEGTVTIAGICFVENGNIPIEDEIEETVQVLKKELIYAGYDTHDLVEKFSENDVQTQFVNFRLATYCNRYTENIYYCEDILSGINYNGNDIYVQNKLCLAHSAFAHELLHSVEEYYLDSMNNDHMTPWFFYEYAENTDADYHKTIEWRVKTRLVCSIGSCEDFRPPACDDLDYWLGL